MPLSQLLTDQSYEKIAEICSALSHPIRLKILDLLSEKQHNCSEILEVLKIPKPNLSQHLNVLKRAKLVKAKKQGLFQFYSINNSELWEMAKKFETSILDSQRKKAHLNESDHRKIV